MSYSQTIANWELPGITLKRVASTNGGEYVSPCPDCGGDDRFHVWPNQGSYGRFWCRQCGKSGDMIEFLRWQKGVSFKEACDAVGKVLPYKTRVSNDSSSFKKSKTPMEVQSSPQKPRIRTDLSWLRPTLTQKASEMNSKNKENDRPNQENNEPNNPSTEETIPPTTVEASEESGPSFTTWIFSKYCKHCPYLDIEDLTAWCFYANKYWEHEKLKSCPAMRKPSYKERESQDNLFQIRGW